MIIKYVEISFYAIFFITTHYSDSYSNRNVMKGVFK